jgi:hypothetical protein
VKTKKDWGGGGWEESVCGVGPIGAEAKNGPETKKADGGSVPPHPMKRESLGGVVESDWWWRWAERGGAQTGQDEK